MMLFNTIIAPVFIVLFALSCTITARPSLQRRGLPGAYYTCTDPDFRGNCAWTAPTEQCRQQGPFNLGIESIGPDPGGYCILYEKADCTGKEIQTVRFPGASSGIPNFGAFKCFVDRKRGTAAQSDGEVGVSAKALDALADPRLAGGVGSADRMKHLEEIQQMEKDGFKDGLIGLKKGIYY